MRNTSVALAAMSLLIGASFSFAARPQPSTVSLQAVVKGLNNPTYVADPGDGSSRLFITLQAGRIVVFEGKRVLPTPFLDLTSLVSCCSDGGLFGIAFDPRYASNRYFYVLYSDSPGDLANTHIVIARYQTSATKPNVADPASATIMLKIPHPIHTDHYGGMLQFRPGDRDECKLNGGRCYLYISTGDGGRYPNGAGDPEGNAQDLGSLLGKMLRIDVTNVSQLYSIPANNPFVSTPGAMPEIWALGLRNPWRFSFDRGDPVSGAGRGDLFIGDVGQDNAEEVHYEPAQAGGLNYGWSLLEGSACYNPPPGEPGCDPSNSTLTAPLLVYDHSAGDCSITGGYRYWGASTSKVYGKYLFADFCTGRIWAVPNASGQWIKAEPVTVAPAKVVSFGEDGAGQVYVVTYGPSGVVYRIQ